MREFAGAVQPYAHYGRGLAQWQLRLHRFNEASEPNTDSHAIIEISPRTYDPKATRITLFHALLFYVLGRIWQAANPADNEFATLMARLSAIFGTVRNVFERNITASEQSAIRQELMSMCLSYLERSGG